MFADVGFKSHNQYMVRKLWHMTVTGKLNLYTLTHTEKVVLAVMAFAAIWLELTFGFGLFQLAVVGWFVGEPKGFMIGAFSFILANSALSVLGTLLRDEHRLQLRNTGRDLVAITMFTASIGLLASLTGLDWVRFGTLAILMLGTSLKLFRR